MIKGARKQMIVLRTGSSRYFDEAYFVLRNDVSDGAAKRNDILNEANKILSENTSAHRPAEHPQRLRWCFFFAGILCGAFCASLTLCLIFF
ncbi:MAG: hypothetical protein IJX80_01080 [Clostridia bacterium]|nr:hypothetical protein [Clostridia bacterium]